LFIKFCIIPLPFQLQIKLIEYKREPAWSVAYDGCRQPSQPRDVTVSNGNVSQQRLDVTSQWNA